MTTRPANDPHNETGAPIHHAETVADARKLARRSRRCEVYVITSDHGGLEVRTSRAAILEALADCDPDSPCGGIYWEAYDTFRLDRCC